MIRNKIKFPHNLTLLNTESKKKITEHSLSAESWSEFLFVLI